MFSFYIILAYVQIVVNLRYTLRVFVQLYFQFFGYFLQTLLIRHNKEGHNGYLRDPRLVFVCLFVS